MVVDNRSIITVDCGVRSGKPCIRGMRITVSDVFDALGAGLSPAQVLEKYPYLTEEDILACSAFAPRDHNRRSPLGHLVHTGRKSAVEAVLSSVDAVAAFA